ncbi:hypothetical protein D4100_05755 [Serratia inhibens]|uniref:Uncharacterized protein n=1 Tax=Serratia inhibens TaxID=2338073 RepID=A0AA93BXH3_9GAMM|nr:hypothetical protein D4100_05755 [Serratia inhibens]
MAYFTLCRGAKISMNLIVNKLYHSHEKSLEMPGRRNGEIGGGSKSCRRIPHSIRFLHLMQRKNQHLMLKAALHVTHLRMLYNCGGYLRFNAPQAATHRWALCGYS